ncbi:hypothetical protein G7046_g2279 [Stylonectria norvegica]|nr:hypothetical protein G7046_g2279 [Stylonectria norvegica]
MSISKLSPKTFDANVWYQITEGRVDTYDSDKFTSAFQIGENGTLVVHPAVDTYWQFQPVDDKDGRYAVRCRQTGVFKQLGVCFVPTEIADSKTQPCLVDSNGSDAQKWDIADWGNSTYRFVNVKNGTDYVMDVHPGNPPFMSNDLRTNIPQPAQHWLMTSVMDIDDGAFSTTFTNKPSATNHATTTTGTATDSSSTATSDSASATSSSSSSSSSSKGLSTGAAAGIGVGVGLVALFALLAGLFFWRKRRRQAANTSSVAETAYNDDKAPPAYPAHQGDYALVVPQEMSGETVHEAPSHFYSSELDSTPIGVSQTMSPMSPETHPESVRNSQMMSSEQDSRRSQMISPEPDSSPAGDASTLSPATPKAHVAHVDE